MLKLYNSASRKKEIFVPYRSGEVRMYACGVTVYDHCHLGHARAAVVFDVLYRYLRQKGYQVTYVRNFTDIDDKIITRAQERQVSWNEIARLYEASFEADMAALAVEPPTHEPRATETMAEIISLIARLIETGVAYVAGGDVFFSVRDFPAYGKLAHKNLDELASGARVEINEAKRDPLDFALWKKAKAGEPAWESPWGPGRPGWHIECSAMALKFLGERLDIHCGGRDLMFPHHENEIAQSEAATGEPFVKYWLHNGLVNLGKAKMSKSTGNFLSLKALLEQYDYEVIRLFILRAHYRSPLDYSSKHLDDSRLGLERFYETLRRLGGQSITRTSSRGLTEAVGKLRDTYTTAMGDDLNTAQVVGAVFELVTLINKTIEESPSQGRGRSRSRRSPGSSR